MYPQRLCRLGAGQYRRASELAGHCNLRQAWQIRRRGPALMLLAPMTLSDGAAVPNE